MKRAFHRCLIGDPYGGAARESEERRRMRRRTVKIAAGVAALAALGLGGAAIAGANGAFDDEGGSIGGAEAAHARAAALAITVGGAANAVERDSEDGATYEVEVTRKDGTTVDVRLDKSFRRVAVESDSEANDSNDG
jgi:hypothetical protein